MTCGNAGKYNPVHRGRKEGGGGGRGWSNHADWSATPTKGTENR